MRKIAFMLLASVTIILASCGNGATKEEQKDSTAVDSVKVDTTVVAEPVDTTKEAEPIVKE